MSEDEEKDGIFSQPFSDQERAQIKTLVRFLIVVLVFVMLAALTVGFIVTQLS